MEQELDDILERYEAAKAEATRDLQQLLAQKTAEILERQGLFEKLSSRLLGVQRNVRDVVLDREMESFRPSRSNQSVTGYSQAVLRRDGRLYKLLVLGEEDDGEWNYVGELREELRPDEYLGLAPHFIRTLDGLIIQMEKAKFLGVPRLDF